MLSTSKTLFRNPAGGGPGPTDPSFAYVPLLLNTGTTNGQQNNTFLDSSTNNFTITRNGTPTQGSITPYWPNGQWSNLFAANGDYISVPDAANLELGNSDFQMSAWVYLTAYPANNLGSYASAILSKGTFAGTRSYTFTVDGVSGASLSVNLTNAGGTGTNITGSFSFALNTWYAVRATRVSNRVYLFVNGTLLNAGGTAYTDTVSNGTDTLKVGRANLDANYVFQLFGYVSNVSLAIGGSGYSTANYTPATTPTTTVTSDIKFLSCQSNRFVDNSSVPAVVTVTGTPRVQAFQPFSPTASYTTALYGGSGYFNGSTDYLSETDLTPITFGTGDFTIEFWHYLISKATAYPIVFYISGNSSGTSNVRIEFDATHNISGPTSYNIYAPGLIINAGTVAYNTWSHIALVRSSNTLTLYLNGASIGSASVTGVSFGGTGTGLRVMGDGGASNYAYGYLSNFRIVKGTAVYTAAFTPPTSPVTAVTNTSLLLNMANAGIYDAAVQNDFITAGAAVTNTTTKQWPPSSVSFNGSTSYLTAPSNVALAFGSADFTIEFWMYANAIPTNPLIAQLYDTRPASTNGAYILIYLDNDGTIKLWVNSANRITSSVISTGAWIYVALTRSSGVTKMFLNGTQTGSNYTDSTVYLASAPFIGASFSGGAAIANFFNGYIQDFRITNGVARTIATPTAAFPTR